MDKEDLLGNVDNKLKEVLSKIPQFRDKRQLIHHYVAYEFPNKQQYLVDFWEQTFTTVMLHYFKKASIKKFELKEVFSFNKFSPQSFDSILNVMASKGDIFQDKDLDTPEVYARLGLSIDVESKVERKSLMSRVSDIMNPFNLFKNKGEEHVFKNDDILIFFDLLKQNVLKIIKELPSIFQDCCVKKESEFDEYLIRVMTSNYENLRVFCQLNCSKDDLRYYKNILLKSHSLSQDSVDLGAYSVKCFVYNPNKKDTLAEKTSFKLKTTIEYFDNRLKTLDQQIDATHDEAYRAYKKKNVNQAKLILRKEKMLKDRHQELAEKKYALEDQLLSIESASSSKDLVNLLKLVNTTQNEFRVNPDEVYDLKEDLKAADRDRDEINQMLAFENPEKTVEIDEEMKRLEDELYKELLGGTSNTMSNTTTSNSMTLEDQKVRALDKNNSIKPSTSRDLNMSLEEEKFAEPEAMMN